jgi:hypothetical protein
MTLYYAPRSVSFRSVPFLKVPLAKTDAYMPNETKRIHEEKRRK